MRFEEPSSMVRWDSPLYSIAWDDDILNERTKKDGQEEAEGGDGLKRNTTLDDLWAALTTGTKKGPTAAVAQVSHTWSAIHRHYGLKRLIRDFRPGYRPRSLHRTPFKY